MSISARDIAVEIGNALNSTEQIEVLKVGVSRERNIIEARCRCLYEAHWLRTLQVLLQTASGYRLHVCQKYELDEQQELSRGWYLGITAEDLVKAKTQFVNQLLRAKAKADPEKTSRSVQPVKAGETQSKAKPVRPTTTSNKKLVSKTVNSGTYPDGTTYKEVPLAWKTNPEMQEPGKRGALPVRSV